MPHRAVLAPVPDLDSTVADHATQLHEVKVTQAVHAEQLKAHERIAEKSEEAVSKLEQTLDRLLARVDRTERRLIVASVVIFASTQKGGEILKVIGGMLQ